jgi:Uma2 family endonuclease
MRSDSMTLATHRRMTVEDYLAYLEGREGRYELVDGALLEMGAESRLNEKIALYLLQQFLQFVSIDLIARGTQITVTDSTATTRNPDLLVLTPALDRALTQATQSLITLDMPPPILVVEVVSPGKPGNENYDRDYIAKRLEYAARQIFEYWIIDPQNQVILVLNLKDDRYVGQSFSGARRIESPTFPHLTLTAEQILKAGH